MGIGKRMSSIAWGEAQTEDVVRIRMPEDVRSEGLDLATAKSYPQSTRGLASTMTFCGKYSLRASAGESGDRRIPGRRIAHQALF
jgi:hypothetical protein